MKSSFILILFYLMGSNSCNAQFISNDGEFHLIAGAVISSGTYAIVYSTTKNKKKAFWYSVGMATLAGITKETLDSTKKSNTFDVGDLAATTFGGFVASATLSLFVGKQKRRRYVALVN